MKANRAVGNVPQLGIVKHQIILVMHLGKHFDE